MEAGSRLKYDLVPLAKVRMPDWCRAEIMNFFNRSVFFIPLPPSKCDKSEGLSAGGRWLNCKNILENYILLRNDGTGAMLFNLACKKHGDFRAGRIPLKELAVIIERQTVCRQKKAILKLIRKNEDKELITPVKNRQAILNKMKAAKRLELPPYKERY